MAISKFLSILLSKFAHLLSTSREILSTFKNILSHFGLLLSTLNKILSTQMQKSIFPTTQKHQTLHTMRTWCLFNVNFFQKVLQLLPYSQPLSGAGS
jgi:hypothetical protein